MWYLYFLNVAQQKLWQTVILSVVIITEIRTSRRQLTIKNERSVLLHIIKL